MSKNINTFMEKLMPHPLRDIHRWVSGSTSDRRRNGLEQLVKKEHGDQAEAHSFGPETDGGVPESNNPRAAQVAWEKLLVVLLGLRQIQPADVAEPWAHDVKHLSPERQAQLNLADQAFGVVTSDVVTRVSTQPEAVFDAPELLKLERDLKVLGEREYLKRHRTILTDKRRSHELFTTEPHFYVAFRVGVCWWSSYSQVGVSEVEIFVRFKQLPRHVVERAYLPGGTASYSGPRVDLTELAPQFADIIMIRNADSDEVWQPLPVDALPVMVKFGLLPEAQLHDLFLAGQSMPNEQVGIVPQVERLNWSPAMTGPAESAGQPKVVPFPSAETMQEAGEKDDESIHRAS